MSFAIVEHIFSTQFMGIDFEAPNEGPEEDHIDSDSCEQPKPTAVILGEVLYNPKNASISENAIKEIKKLLIQEGGLEGVEGRVVIFGQAYKAKIVQVHDETFLNIQRDPIHPNVWDLLDNQLMKQLWNTAGRPEYHKQEIHHIPEIPRKKWEDMTPEERAKEKEKYRRLAEDIDTILNGNRHKVRGPLRNRQQFYAHWKTNTDDN